MRRSPGSLTALLFALAACGGGESNSPAAVPLPGESTTTALAKESTPETPPALSPAELEPGKPIDLGDGLILQVDRAGTGKTAHLGSRVELRYEARIKDSETLVGTTEGWDAPLAATLGGGEGVRLLPALERALTGLRAGCSAKLEVPPALGYGKNGPPGAEDKTLVFQIELVGVDG
jgi:FKBP-type peptidyl-prolyl cis-trans isomerase